MKRKDIVEQLIQDVKNNFHVSNGYTIQPVNVYRGYYQFDQIKQTPALAFTVTTDGKIDNLDDGKELRSLEISAYGYAKTDGAGDTSEIHDLLNDLENFLGSEDFSYSDRFNGTGNITIYEGGATDPACIFQMDFSIIYVKE